MGGEFRARLWLLGVTCWFGFTHVDHDLPTLGELQPDAEAAAPAPAWYAGGLPGRTDPDGSVTFLGRRPLADVSAGALTASEREAALRAHFIAATGGATEFRLVASHRDGPGDSSLRLVFVQTFMEVPLLGTYALAKLDAEHLTYARHFVVDPARIAAGHTELVGPLTDSPVDAAQAEATATADIARHAQRAHLTHPPERAWLYQDEAFALVWDVPVRSDSPFGQWSVYVDANFDTVRGRKKFSFDAVTGTVSAQVEPRCQGDLPEEQVLPHIDWGEGRFTGADGQFFFAGDADEALVTLSGPYARIIAPVGTEMAWAGPLIGEPGHNTVASDADPSAQVNAFVYVHQARRWLLDTLGETADVDSRVLRWTQSQLPVRVDLPSGHRGQSCNAFYDGESLNFFVADARLGCNNTGRVAKIVYHEYGHGVHDHLTASRATLNKQVSEGAADYIAATITGDPHITGLLGCDTVIQGGVGPRGNLRSCRNNYNFCRDRRCSSHPRDEEHNAGPVLCGALWDLREAMVARYGDEEGVSRADRFVLRFLALVTDMSSAYAAAIAADEDDDANPANGTTHSCEINAAFLGQGTNRRAHFPEAVKDRVPCLPR